MEKALAGLTESVGGGSGLYDAVAAAYDRGRASWAAGHTDSVVVVADGPNEDDYGLTLGLLKQRLASAKDPARPVRVVLVGLGDKADAASIKDIAGRLGTATWPRPPSTTSGPCCSPDRVAKTGPGNELRRAGRLTELTAQCSEPASSKAASWRTEPASSPLRALRSRRSSLGSEKRATLRRR